HAARRRRQPGGRGARRLYVSTARASSARPKGEERIDRAFADGASGYAYDDPATHQPIAAATITSTISSTRRGRPPARWRDAGPATSDGNRPDAEGDSRRAGYCPVAGTIGGPGS